MSRGSARAARWAIRGTAIAIVLGAVGGGAAFFLKHRAELSGASEVVTEDYEVVQNIWLMPGLVDAQVIVPDRPHSREEALAHREGRGEITRVRRFTISTNSLRMRAPELGPKEAGVPRILVLGESVAMGWGVDDDETFPARLEDELDDRGYEVEVLNAGSPSARPLAMSRWCIENGPKVDPDLLIWNGRPMQQDDYVGDLRRCVEALRVPTLAILSPISTFDPNGSVVYKEEHRKLKEQLKPDGIDVIDLTRGFRKAQRGRGEVLEAKDNLLTVVDQESDRVWLTAERPHFGLPQEIYDLFETTPEVREHLFFDEGHPDAEGHALYGELVADEVAPMLDALR